jgi:hypothetical protein
MPTPTIAAFGIFFGLLLTESWFSWRFLRKLRRDYPEAWRKTGKRTIWTDKDAWGAWPTIKLLRDRKYEKACTTEDEIKFFERYRTPVIYSYYGLWVGGGLVFVCLLVFGWQ